MTHIEIANNVLENDMAEIKYTYKMLQSPQQLRDSKHGDCFEQVELARDLLEKQGIKCTTYCSEINRGDWVNFIVHGFIVFEEDGKFYWFERAMAGGRFRGVHEYSSLKDLIVDFKNKSTEYFKTIKKIPANNQIIRQYSRPEFPISYTDHILDCLSSEVIEIEQL